MSNDGIHKADPAARRIAILMIVCVAIAGAVFVLAANQFRPQFENWLREDLRVRIWIVVALVDAAVVLPLLGAAGYLWHLGTRIARAARYPPPELRVLHDTEIVTGVTARRRAYAVRALACVLALAAVLLVYFMWRVVFLLLSSSVT
jgi:hypothetical protein